MQISTMKRAESFDRKTIDFEPSALTDKTNENKPRQTTFGSNKLETENQLFKVTTKIPIRIKAISSTVSPKKGVQSGRVGDTKAKKSLFPSRNINYSRNLVFLKSRNTAKREILQKVVEILNKDKQFKPPTPEKTTFPITHGTPGSARGYLVLPEYKKLRMRQKGITHCTDISKKKGVSRSPLSTITNNNTPDVKMSNIEHYRQMLNHCRMYSSEVDTIYQKIRKMDEDFENKAKNTSEFVVYQNYCKYETKKDKLYEELKELEEKFKHLLKNKTECGSKLDDFFKRKKELFEDIMKYHNEFKNTVQVALEKSKKEVVDEELQSEK